MFSLLCVRGQGEKALSRMSEPIICNRIRFQDVANTQILQQNHVHKQGSTCTMTNTIEFLEKKRVWIDFFK